MNAAELLAQGGEVAVQPVTRAVEWTNPAGEVKAFEVVILPANARSIIRAQQMHAAGDDREALFVHLAAHVLLGDDHQPMAYETVERLHPSLLALLAKTVAEVHGVEDAPKN